jgi:nucleoside-diphosphate-sugar epimerase
MSVAPRTVIRSEAELEERLSRPSEADVTAMKSLTGDLVVLGAGGKMGPSLVRRAHRAVQQAGTATRVIAVARFSQTGLERSLQSEGIETLSCDLLETGALDGLPDAPNVIFMAARKFGTTGAAHLTWAMNTHLPGLVATRYCQSKIVAFSTGNVYPLLPIAHGGATESTPTAPVGEYGQSALGRERMFEYASDRWGTPVCLLRLNYAIDLRYGVLVDIARAVFERRPVHLHMGLVNVVWQGDANSYCLRAFEYCQSPPSVLNLTGPETLPVEYIAREFGRRFDIEPVFDGEPGATALLSNAAKVHQAFGYPTVTPGEMMDWIASWVAGGGPMLDKPTHFQVRDGKF